MLKKVRHTQASCNKLQLDWHTVQSLCLGPFQVLLFAHAGSEGGPHQGGKKRCLLLLIKALSLLTAPPRGSLTAETVTLESQQTGFYRVVMRKPVQKKDTQKGKEVRVRSRQDYTDAVQTHLLEHAERVLVMQSRQIPNDKLLLLKASARIKNSQKCVCLSTHETPKHVCFCFFSLSQSTAGYGKITFCE